MLLRYTGETAYHGSGPKWLPGAERDVDPARGEWLLKHFPGLFVDVGAETAPLASPPPAPRPVPRTKPAGGMKKG